MAKILVVDDELEFLKMVKWSKQWLGRKAKKTLKEK